MSQVIILGGGPAGLAAAYDLAKNGVANLVLEKDRQVGGISKTIIYKDFYFDLGGHRFFTKFPEVEALWREVLAANFQKTPRLSRIYYRNKFFNYPLTPLNALFGVGIGATLVIIGSYLKAKMFPSRPEDTFEQWVSNRFGKKLFTMFFKTYTEKVWGIPCSSIQAEWAAQRIKGLSLSSAIYNALFKPKNSNIKTLIDEFDYPVFGPGMMYSEMKAKAELTGASRCLSECEVVKLNHVGFTVKSVVYRDPNGQRRLIDGSHFISSIPITELIAGIDPPAPPAVLAAAQKLQYRSLITVDIIINKAKIFPDNWIYIHSPEVKLGRIQNFKNWSARMVPDPRKSSLGLEYFCNEHDELWEMPDEELFSLAAAEVEKIRICQKADIEDYVVVRVPKAYPVYNLGYQESLAVVAKYLRQFSNLQPVGRYGLFKYNNMDHSIMTGLYASENIRAGNRLYDTWSINVDAEYHEEKKTDGDYPSKKTKTADI
ncbi:MAG: NAD(P)/FAD-dependent oxidoreductase [Bacillota bacterium]|jgi:protoporphyrinogen oxidase